MFGIDDPGIWSAYLLAFLCIVFSAWFGIKNWNRDDNDDNNSKKSDK